MSSSEPPNAEPPVDPSRRLFFRRFAGDVVSAAATVLGAAQALQQQSADAARELLAGDERATTSAPPGTAPRPRAPSGFKPAFRWDADGLYVIDQRVLPEELFEYRITGAYEAANAIRDMLVRGAPAIGQVAAIGIALTGERMAGAKPFARRASLRAAVNVLKNARPTAANLAWACDRMYARYEAAGDIDAEGDVIAAALRDEAEQIVHEASTDHGRLIANGRRILPIVQARPLRLLTHCNTGPLACGQAGTALGVIQSAHHAGVSVHVWVDETRPYLQGARLTAWELAQGGVPHTLIADSAAGMLMARGDVDAVLVGADRVAANGDTANKVGTYPLAVLAARHGVPFFVCAPSSSLDPSTPDGASIRIEERSPDEVVRVRGVRIAPESTSAFNPAFDITPAELVTAIVTDEDVLRPPFGDGVALTVVAHDARWKSEPRFAHLARAASDGVAT